MPEPPVISFMSDFGVGATAPAVCRGVMLGIARDARIIDITHAVRQFGVRDGAFLLARTLPYMPVGVHVAVVDPGVGTQRRPIGIQVERGDVLVGPDNGLLRPAAEALGGVREARVLQNAELWLPTVSHTFHGRDIFSPVAAHLATGVAFDQVGPVVATDELAALVLPAATPRDGGLDTAVLFIDAFGNCRLAGTTDDVAGLVDALHPGTPFSIEIAGADGQPRRIGLPWVETFGDVDPGEPLLFEDADYAGPALGVNQGSAAERYGLELDSPIRLEPA